MTTPRTTPKATPRQVATHQQASSGTAVPAPPESRRRAWGLTSLLVFLTVINWGDKAVLGIIAQPLSKELGLTASQIGLVGSLFFLTFTIGGFFSGAIARITTLRWALAVLALLWSAAMLPMVITASFAVLVVSRMLLGLAEGPSGPLTHTAAFSWHPPAKRGLPGALLAGSASLAKIAVAPALAFVTVTWGWRAAVVCMAVLGVLWCVLWLPLWSQGPYIRSGKRREEAGAGAAETDEPAVPWIRIFRTRTFISCTMLVMAIYAIVAVVLTWLPSYFEVGLGYSRLQAGSMFAFPSIAGLILMLILSSSGDRLTSRGATSRLIRIIVPSVGVLVSGMIMVFLPYVSAPALAVAIVSVGYGFLASGYPLIIATISEICPPRQTAGTLGVFMAMMGIGGLIGPYVTGRIVDAADTPAAGYATAFQAFGLVAVLFAFGTLIFANPERDKEIVWKATSRT
ncbi:ACS family hexuronate transporter-like MFS transporter [Rhodococcus sp. OAS809]|uniref:MFS transporter n=1 Tax=Rhodococcus TaxID=1827 RepID=UPI0001A214B4|nr:transporter, major facilitator family protein [Rhodococcus erythropolis SK121]